MRRRTFLQAIGAAVVGVGAGLSMLVPKITLADQRRVTRQIRMSTGTGHRWLGVDFGTEPSYVAFMPSGATNRMLADHTYDAMRYCAALADDPTLKWIRVCRERAIRDASGFKAIVSHGKLSEVLYDDETEQHLAWLSRIEQHHREYLMEQFT